MTSENNLYVEKNKAEVSKNVPELRFQGFIDAWEQRKLEELGNLNRGKSKHRPRNDSRLFGGEYPFIQTGDVAKAPLFLTEYSQTYSEFGIQQSKLWDIGTLLITIAANVADTTILGIKAAFPDSVIGFESTSCDVVFIKNYIDIKSDLLKRKAETSSQANLNLAKLKEMNLNVPKLKEQQKIGSFFKQLDDTIALHQRKLDKLKLLKKGYLQQIFPQNGEKVPRVRFTNFENEWEPRKLKDLGIIQTGNTPKTSNAENYNENGVLWITPTDIEYLITNNSAKKLSAEGYSKARIADSGSILVTCIASIGKNTLVEEPSGFNQQINSLTPNKLNNSYFLLTQSELWSTKMKGIASSGTMQIVNKNDFSNLLFLYPKLEEQKKIGSFFKQLDYTIALHQSKLDKLNTLKQGLLQKMFL
ncbi:restriction endonuclease subunit S [Lactococcus lactis]|uniref:Type I restriction enzyme S subunit n=1 Tax=Lactococcus lactis TaxID=1358 RepID=A0AAW5TLW7_9LACT|nr:restriction endonuclease subunit S [Lactococcus lactis]MCW2279683.1 type I restriction enzyme S subunit [Lactococcus lactis]